MEGVVPQHLDDTDENNDRELISDYMRHMLTTQSLLFKIENENK